MNDRKRSATNGDTPRPKKTRSANPDESASTKAPLPPPPIRPLRKLPSKPNHLLKLTKAASKSASSDSSGAGKKGNRWSESDDTLLTNSVQSVQMTNPGLEGNGVWIQVSQLLGTERSAKQCRERWTNYLRPGIKKGEWTAEEEELIHDMYRTFGPRWSAMAKLMKDRTDNDIKNKWNATKRSQQRKHARLSPQVSSLSTETASLASLEQHWSNISPKKLAMTQPTDATITLSKQEDEEHITEV